MRGAAPIRIAEIARVSRASPTVARHRFRARAPSVAAEPPVFSAEVWSRLARSLQLSPREAQIVPALFDDEKESAIAMHLGISRHTVLTYTERLYRKMAVSSRVGLVRRIFLEYLSLANG